MFNTIALFEGGIDFRSLVRQSSRLSNTLSQIMKRNFCVLLPAHERELILYFREQGYRNVVVVDRQDRWGGVAESFEGYIVADPQKYEALFSAAKYSLSVHSLVGAKNF